MHSSTLRLANLHLAYVDCFKLFPITWNSATKKWQVVPERVIGLLYFNVVFFGAHVAYYWTTIYLILKGYVPSTPAATSILFIFGIGATLNVVAQARLIVDRKEWCQLINTARQTFNYLNEAYLARVQVRDASRKLKDETKIADWEVLTQILIIAFGFVQPCMVYAFYWTNPLARQYPTSILIKNYQLVQPFSALLVILYSLVLGFQGLQAMQYAFVHIVVIGYVIYSMLFWLQKISALPGKSEDALQVLDVFHIYHCVYLYHQERLAVLRYFTTPAVFIFIFSFGVTSNFVLINFHTTLPVYASVFLLNMSLVIVGVLMTMVPTTTDLHIGSSKFIRVWTNHARANHQGAEKKLYMTFLKSCNPVKPYAADFLFFQKSSTYKMTLFLVLHTMKALLMFGRKKAHH